MATTHLAQLLSINAHKLDRTRHLTTLIQSVQIQNLVSKLDMHCIVVSNIGKGQKNTLP